ncbi:MAG: polyprenyl synthetase family protein [Planctomycetes bacterium]|nr:polyprenyl synthetase family protein [Planctomycetota bacterium]
MQQRDFKERLSENAEKVNNVLRGILADRNLIGGELGEVFKYVLEAEGKRIRGALVLWGCEVVSGQVNRNAEIAAAAIEMVHTYSLIHDDLPAMDDDEIRRGKPACHIAFDEATAILAGDGLLTLAFEILSKEIDDAGVAIKLVGQLAGSAGPAGMVAGQLADLQSEKTKGSEEQLEYIHTNKTAKMFQCSVAMGAIAGGAKRGEYESLCEYGLKIGLGFQVADDILDVSGSSKQLGKTAGKDEKAGKITYPSLLGIEGSKERAVKLAEEAVEALGSFGEKAEVLRQLAKALLERTR